MKSLKPKFILSLLFFVLMSTCFTSCIVHHPRTRTVVIKQKRLPPGQAKKIYGGNAKDYAPGQQKKKK
jgi:hypothetical protein